MKLKIVAVGIYSLLALFIFWKLPQTFFQQDEWAIFGNIIYADKVGLSLFDRLFIYEQYTHLIPISNAVTLALYRIFGVTLAPWAYVSIFFHVVNAYLVFVLAKKLLKDNRIALVSGAIFLINSVSHQAVTWMATSVGTVGSSLFFLLSLLIFFIYLEDKKRRLWHLALSFCTFLLSLGFKETSIFGFFFFPILWVLFTPNRARKEGFKFFVPLALFGGLYILVRFFFLSLSPPAVASPALSQPPVAVYFVRAVALPIRILAQSIIPQKFILIAAKGIVRLGYPQFMQGGTPDPYVVESVAADIVSFLVSMVVISVAFAVGSVFVRHKKTHVVRVIAVALLFVTMSALPFVIVPGQAGYNALLDGRHLYLTGIFSSLLFAVFVWGILTSFKKNRIIVGIALVLFLLAMSYHVLKTRRDIEYQVAVGGLRASILNTITAAYPTLPRRVVFFIESDAPYYGLPFEEPIVPFQSGFGQTLLVWYNAHGVELPACLFERNYLYVMMSEDYKECQGQGFGYFRKRSTLNQAIRAYTIDASEILAFRFTSSTNMFQDVTAEIREKIRRFGQL